MTKEQTPALKACPLCHSTNVDLDRDNIGPLTVVWCLDCGCNVDDCTLCASDEPPFDRWQARTPDPGVAGLVEALESERSRATRALMNFAIHRYLMANVRNDGVEKAERHNELVGQFLTVFAPNKRRNIEVKRIVHDATQELTNRLDEIGLGDNCHYEDAVVQAFHDRFIELARQALATWSA